jgi:hypothetical protein
MNKTNIIIVLLCITQTVIPLGQQKEDDKNFYGTFEFRDGTKDNVEKITFNDYNKILKVYTRPANFKTLKQEERLGSQDIKRKTIFLNEDPTDIDRGPRDFITIKEIIVPNPHTDWIYEKSPKHITKYTEIVIDGEPLLIAKNTRVKGVNPKNNSKKIKVKKISRLQKITIDGYKNKITKKSDGQNK